MLSFKSTLRGKILFSYLLIILIAIIAFALTTYFQTTQSILLISLAFFLVSAIIAICLSKQLTKPLDQLIQDTDKMAQTLKQTSDQKRKAEQNLQKTRDELEISVEKRTAQLKREIEDKLLVEEKYKKVMDASPVPIAVYDMDGSPIYINPAFTQTFGWSLNEFQEEKTRYIPPEEYELNVQIRKKIIRGENGHGIETRRYNKYREVLDVNISFDVWRGKNNVPIGCVVILHDITQSKKMEQQLFQSRKMEAMGTLAGGIAHDFNNILSGIFAFSQLAQRHADNASKAKEHIHQIVKGAQRASKLVQQILTFCRQTEYQKKALNFDIIIKEALNLFVSTIPSTITIHEEIASQITIIADSTQIHQVIMNLCTNAYHAMIRTGGTLSVRLTEHQITPQHVSTDFNIKPGTYARLEVQDTGHGMNKEVLEKAFDPYFTTKEVGKGTGFGLALVKAIVEAHDGYIRIHSIPEEGTQFEVYLPCEKYQRIEDCTNSNESTITGGNEHIMVVDDEQSIRLATQEFLEDYGYEITAFKNGDEALKAFKKTPDKFDLVLTDMTMPKMTGDQLVKKLLDIKKELPIILCTGYSEKINESKALKAGVRFFAQKPISNQKLDAMIRSALNPS